MNKRSSKLDDLAALAATADMAAGAPEQGPLFLLGDQDAPQGFPSPAKTANPFVTQPPGAQVPRLAANGDPILDDTIKAMLIIAGLRATWALNHWKVFPPNAHLLTAQVGGSRSRISTGVRREASFVEWQEQINLFLKDTRPKEKPPFGPVTT